MTGSMRAGSKLPSSGLVGAGLIALVLGACVTINVYFPAAAVEKAADKLIEDVWGDDAQPTPPRSEAPDAPMRAATALLGWLLPAAHAQADIDVSTPAVEKLKGQMQDRHGALSPFYASGAVGLTADGLITERDPKAVPLRARQTVIRLVSAENQDRKALYREIARANGHPEWEADIRATFARRWIGRARSGWWYEANGGWRQK